MLAETAVEPAGQLVAANAADPNPVNSTDPNSDVAAIAPTTRPREELPNDWDCKKLEPWVTEDMRGPCGIGMGESKSD